MDHIYDLGTMTRTRYLVLFVSLGPKFAGVIALSPSS